jgi:hypothetical protein
VLKRVAQGVYHLAGAPIPDHIGLRAAWLQLVPDVPAWERTPAEGVVSHRSAAAVFGLGHLPADRHEFTLPPGVSLVDRTCASIIARWLLDLVGDPRTAEWMGAREFPDDLRREVFLRLAEQIAAQREARGVSEDAALSDFAAGRGRRLREGRPLERPVRRADENRGVTERLYRSMKEARDRKPDVGRSARTLGVRPGIDILVEPDGTVVGGAGGMSVAPDSAANLPSHRRPPEHGGTGKDPVWEIGTADLGEALVYHEDPVQPGVHGFVEPSRRMTLEEYERALAATREAWAPTMR